MVSALAAAPEEVKLPGKFTSSNFARFSEASRLPKVEEGEGRVGVLGRNARDETLPFARFSGISN